MRKFTIFFLIVLMITLFTACSSVSNEISLDKYKTGDLPDGAYYLGGEVDSVYPYDNKIYTLSLGGEDSGYQDEIGYYDIKMMEYTKLYSTDEEGPCSIYVNDNGIYYIKNATIYLMDFNCKVKDTIEVLGLELDYEEAYNDIYANGNYIIINNNYLIEKKYEYQIITIDLKTKETKIYPYEKYQDVGDIFNILPTENENEFFIAGSCQIYSFNVKNGKIEMILDGNNLFMDDYMPGEKKIYYLYDNNNIINLGSKSLSSDDSQTTRIIGYDSLYADINNAVTAAGAEMKYIHLYSLYYTGYDYLVWDIVNHTLCVIPPTMDRGKTINVVYRKLAPLSVQFNSEGANEDEMYGNIAQLRLVMKYENEKNVTVKNIGYEYDQFADKMRVKMMAGDTDYDVVHLEHAGDLLAPLLKYNLFLPLENYESLESGFDRYIDGVRDVMTYDGHIYGIPYYLQSKAFYISNDTVREALPVGYTLDDFLNLCSEAGASRLITASNLTKYDVFKTVVNSIIEDGMEKGEISREAILDYVAQHKKYLDAGSLNQNPPGNGRIRIGKGIAHGFSDLNIDYSGMTLRALPSYNGKNYIDVKSMLYISSVSPNTDLAVDYLAYMVSDDFISQSVNYDKSFLVKDMDSYFWYSYGTFDTQYKDQKEPLILYEDGMSGYDTSSIYHEQDKFLVENGADLFYNAAPRLYTYGMDEVLVRVYDGLEGGTLTAEEAADMIYSEAGYQLME